jgi:hypothetical protein
MANMKDQVLNQFDDIIIDVKEEVSGWQRAAEGIMKLDYTFTNKELIQLILWRMLHIEDPDRQMDLANDIRDAAADEQNYFLLDDLITERSAAIIIEIIDTNPQEIIEACDYEE